jgi:thiol-disulfide isomerase/thioredoxin
MKKLILIPFALVATLVFAQPGYEIKVILKPFTNQYVYLGHYSGKQLPVIDSVKLNAKSEAVFKGVKELGGGIYLVAYPDRKTFIEILVDKKQHFTVIADTASSNKKNKFINSPDNELFAAYQQKMAAEGKNIETAKNGLLTASSKDSAKLNEQLKKTNDNISSYRKKVITDHPTTLLATLMRLMEEPVVPPAALQPGGHYDSAFAYRYFKDHYWDGINFFDDRLTRTPASLFEERIDKYYNTLVFPAADSVIKELDWMLGYASISKEMSRVLLVKFITRYLDMKYMWEDAVFVHLYQKYFAQREYDWLTPQGKKLITERAYNLMANILGNPAENIALPNASGSLTMLYADTARYTIVCFWDPTCGHCKETLPKLDSMYRSKWKASGVKIFAVGKETDGTKKDWADFITQHQLQDWIHVYYSKEEEKARVNNNIPGYSQLYDAQTVPAVFLLDKEKRIIAKKLTWEQTDDILQLKIKGQ